MVVTSVPSNDVKRSDVCAFFPMSAQFSNVSTDTNRNSFLQYGCCTHNSLIERCRTFPDPVLVHIPRAALLSDAMVTSDCIPICSKICEVCFDVRHDPDNAVKTLPLRKTVQPDCFATLQSIM